MRVCVREQQQLRVRQNLIWHRILLVRRTAAQEQAARVRQAVRQGPSSGGPLRATVLPQGGLWPHRRVCHFPLPFLRSDVALSLCCWEVHVVLEGGLPTYTLDRRADQRLQATAAHR